MDAGKLGGFIREQRTKARLSLRNVSGLAGVSIPYLSQVERGLRKPSAEILQAIAKGLRISAETLYVQAGILEDRQGPDVGSALLADDTISPHHRQALLEIYEAFRREDGHATELSRDTRKRGAAKAASHDNGEAAPAAKAKGAGRKSPGKKEGGG